MLTLRVAFQMKNGAALDGMKMANGTNPMGRSGFPGTRAKSASLVREVLTEVAQRGDDQHRRLLAIESDVAAFRRLIGTAPTEVTP